MRSACSFPASNTKLFTVALALDRLGPDFRFETRVLADTPPDSEGRIRGAVRLVGGGDPNLSARAVPYRAGPVTGNPLGPIEELADQVVARGVKRIDGGIIGDDTWYVWEPFPEGWAIDDARYEYGAPVSALTVNDNTLTLSVRPGARAGDLAEISLVPGARILRPWTIESAPVAAGGALKIQLDREPGSRQVRLWGTIPVRSSGETLALAVDDPAEFAARALRRALEDRGVTVGGRVDAWHRYPNEEDVPLDAGSYRTGAARIRAAHRRSGDHRQGQPEPSRRTGAAGGGSGAAQHRQPPGRPRRDEGASSTRSASAPDAYSFSDGSGLDRTDLVTPAAIVKLLRHMYGSAAREQWIALLPVGGVDGTLSTRFPEIPAGQRIHAKTGTLDARQRACPVTLSGATEPG